MNLINLGGAYASVPRLYLKAFPHVVAMTRLMIVHRSVLRMSAEADEQAGETGTTQLRDISE